MASSHSPLHRLLHFLRRENLHRMLLALVALSLFSATGLWFLEGADGGPLFADWLWWSIVTLTTVGYGDITPAGVPGRIIGTILMLSGIGLLGILTGTIASFFVEMRIRRERGMGSIELEDHIILCQWNDRAEEVRRELRGDPRTAESPIVLIADIETKPVTDELLHFVHGGINEENLKRACVEQAATVVILGDDQLDAGTRDAQVVLATLTVETLNPDAYTIVEIVEEGNVQHCRRARADEIIVAHQLSSSLMASAAVDHGLSKVVTELLSQRYGNDLRSLPVPADMVGSEFFAAFVEMKKSNSSIVVAVQRSGEVFTNPAMDLELQADDRLIAIVDCH